MNPLIKKEDRLHELNSQLFRAGIIGLLKGCLIGVASGLFLSFRYNRGHNTHFFRRPYKFLYVSSWGFAGIIFETDRAKGHMSKQLAIEEELKRNIFFQEGK